MERGILVTMAWYRDSDWETEDLSAELSRLAKTCFIEPVKEIVCKRDKPSPQYLIGKGKTEEISELAAANGADVVIFNEELKPLQQRNLEKAFNTKVIDRTQLILDIFARRAHSQEGKIQVELAQLKYLLPRLTGEGVLLSRLGGGIGTRGPGEQKLEVDRRGLRKRMSRLEVELEKAKKRRVLSQKTRDRSGVSVIALVGYTNAGKTTLMNFLTGSSSRSRDELFSTLDPMARKFALPNNQKVILSDTVGFLRKLPHHLIEAFRATLEEVTRADILLHVLDISNPLIKQQNDAVWKVLRELNAHQKPVIVVLNKIDALEDNESVIRRFTREFEGSISLSALTGQGIDFLKKKIVDTLAHLLITVNLSIPKGKMALIDVIYKEGIVKKCDYFEDSAHIEAEIPKILANKIKQTLNG